MSSTVLPIDVVQVVHPSLPPASALDTFSYQRASGQRKSNKALLLLLNADKKLSDAKTITIIIRFSKKKIKFFQNYLKFLMSQMEYVILL